MSKERLREIIEEEEEETAKKENGKNEIVEEDIKQQLRVEAGRKFSYVKFDDSAAVNLGMVGDDGETEERVLDGGRQGAERLPSTLDVREDEDGNIKINVKVRRRRAQFIAERKIRETFGCFSGEAIRAAQGGGPRSPTPPWKIPEDVRPDRLHQQHHHLRRLRHRYRPPRPHALPHLAHTADPQPVMGITKNFFWCSNNQVWWVLPRRSG